MSQQGRSSLVLFLSMLWRKDDRAFKVVSALWVKDTTTRIAMHGNIEGCLPSKDRNLKHFFDLVYLQDQEIQNVINDLLQIDKKEREYLSVEEAEDEVLHIIAKREGKKHAKGAHSIPRRCA